MNYEQPSQNSTNLTPAELDSFLKLPKDQQEKEKDDRLAHLKSLNDQLDLAIQEGLKTGKPEEAQRLLEELRQGVQDLGQEIEATEKPITKGYVEAVYTRPGGQKETITLAFEAKLQDFISFYQKTNVDLLKNYSLKMVL